MDYFKLDIIKEGIYLKNHMIKFIPETQLLLLYDLKGVLLDEQYFKYIIDDICIIDDNYILFRKLYNLIIQIKIINNHIELIDELFIPKQKIYDFIYNKENKLLIISFETIIGIWDIDSLLKNPIQIIKIEICSPNLLNFNSNVFIAYGDEKILIFQKTNNRNLYQLSTILDLFNFNIFNELNFKELFQNYISYKLNLLKMDNKTLMITQNKEIYFLDIRNMMIKNRFTFKNEKSEIKFVYNKNNDIHLFIGENIYTTRYNKYNFQVISKIKKSKYSYPEPNPLTANLKNENNFNYNDTIKFFSFKNNKASIYFENYLKKLFLVRYFEEILPKRISIINKILKLNPQLLIDKMNSDKNKKKIRIETKKRIEAKKRIEIKNSKNYLIIFGKRNFVKRGKLKKINEIKNEKIRNTTKFKKNFR